MCKLTLPSGTAWLPIAFVLAGLISTSAQVPVITTQPQSQSKVLGYPATLSVSAINPPLFYQWRKESVPIPGATGSTLALPGVNYTNTGTYSVLVSNVNGTTVSANAILTITPPAAGDLDFTFNSGSGANGTVYSVAAQADGKVLISGTFTSVNGASRNYITRLNGDGSLDTTFQNGMAGANDYVISVAAQADGKALIGGWFTTVNGTNRGSIARLHADGSLDTTFQNGMIGANFVVYSVVAQADGKVLIGGDFTSVNGTSRNRMARLNADGSLDPTFQNGMAGANSHIWSLAAQADGKVLIGGGFTSVNGTPRNRIARLHADGSLDTTFQNGMTGANSSVYPVVAQADGTVLIGGLFTTVNGTSCNRIARLHADGSLDTTFQNGMTGANSVVYSMALQADGKVLIGGAFTTVNGTNRSRIARLNADGSLDTTFQNGMTGANLQIWSMASQADGRVLIGGDFTTVNGTSRNRIARLYGAAGSYDTADADGDGLANAFERQSGLNPEIPNRQVGTGAAGPLTVNRIAYTDDVWARVLGSNPAGQASLKVSTTNGFAPNDLVMMITMQDPNTNLTQNAAGTYELGRIATLTSNALTLTQPRNHAFVAGAGLRFDGVNDYVSINAGEVLSNRSFTVEFWAQRGNSGSWDQFCMGQGTGLVNKGLHIGFRGNTMLFGFYGNDLQSLTSITDLGWHHWSMTYNATSNQRRIFLDGTLNREDTPPSGAYQGSGALWLGNSPAVNGPYQGSLDEVRIWNVARSQPDIANTMSQRLTGTEPGLVAYYRLDEGAGTTTSDATGNGLTGTLLNGPTWTTNSSLSAEQKIQVLKVPEYTDVTVAGSGSALQFSGASQYISAAPTSMPIGNPQYTIEAWIKPDVMNGGGIVGWGAYGANNQVNAFRLESNGLRNYWWNNDLVAPVGSLVGAWHHVAATFDGVTRRILVDGVVSASDTPTGHNLPAATNFTIGKTATSEFFDGLLDEVRIWSVVRSPAEIANNMRRALTGSEPGLVAYYRLDENAGTTANDATADHANGTLVNGPTWTNDTPLPGNLTCRPWDGTSGGVLAFLAQNVTVGTSISADGKGYRGGLGVPSVGNWESGITGERTTGFSTNRAPNSFEQPQGGGGAGKGADGSGGGGGYGSAGAQGDFAIASSDYGRGATSFGDNTLPRLNAGGGGGGSGSHNAGRVGVAGGAGGGIVFVAAGSIAGSGTISSRGDGGQTGISAADANSGSGGGGGAGGSVYLLGNPTSTIQVLAIGGAGGPRNALSGNSKNGGAGGVGRIRLDVPASSALPTSLSPAPGWRAQLSVNDPATSLIWGAPYLDGNNDGTNDWQQFNLWTLQDADGDGVANLVETERGTDSSNADSDGDGLTDYQELFVYHTDPLQADTDGDGTSDNAEVAAGGNPLSSALPDTAHHYQYDPLNRLVGVDYTNGLSLLFSYDGNDNLLHQAFLTRAPDTNGMIYDTNSIFADTDGDGFGNGQELWAGTDPLNALSAPLLGPVGSNITAGIVFPFTPDHCVVAVGQLDGIGAEEIVVSADGNPGATTNFLVILSQTATGWSTQRVDIGPFGVTSLAVGQPANRPSPAIYAGLRQAGGLGQVVEFTRVGGGWTSATIATSTSDAASVLGVRAGNDVLANLARGGAPLGGASYLKFVTNTWTSVLASGEAATRGLGTVTTPGLHGVSPRGVRALDSGLIQVVGHDVNVPTNAIWNGYYLRWFFRTASSTDWASAQNLARNTYGGNLATVTDATLDTWLWNQFGAGVNPGLWIGLSRSSVNAPWQWASGTLFSYANWLPNEPFGDGNFAAKWFNGVPGKWNDYPGALTGIVEVGTVEAPSVLASQPSAAQRLVWKGHSLNTGNLRLTSAVSILYTFVDDKNLNNLMDANDDLVVAEYLYDGTNLTALGTQIAPLSGSALAQSYGLASLEVLYGNQQVLFTAEPDGRIFSWSATNTTAPLQRQLFSAHDLGKAWHALAGVRTLDPAQSLLGLRVDPAAPNRCDVVLWPPQRELFVAAEYPQTAPVTQILPAPNAGTNLASVDIRCWDAEANSVRLTLQYQLPLSSAWSDATIYPDQSVTTYPTGRTHRVYWDALQDLGSGFTNVVNLRAQAQDVSLSGDWSAAVAYQVQTFVGNNPQAFNDAAFTSMNQAVDIDVLANDTMTNGAPKLIASVELPLYGSAATNANQTVHYTPAAGFVGTDGFGYVLTDGAGGFSWAWVTVTVTDAPAAPIVIDSPVMQAGNQFSMLISGPPGQVYQVQVSTNLTNWSAVGTVTNVTGTVPYLEQPVTNASRFYRAMLLP